MNNTKLYEFHPLLERLSELEPGEKVRKYSTINWVNGKYESHRWISRLSVWTWVLVVCMLELLKVSSFNILLLSQLTLMDQRDCQPHSWAGALWLPTPEWHSSTPPPSSTGCWCCVTTLSTSSTCLTSLFSTWQAPTNSRVCLLSVSTLIQCQRILSVSRYLNI